MIKSIKHNPDFGQAQLFERFLEFLHTGDHQELFFYFKKFGNLFVIGLPIGRGDYVHVSSKEPNLSESPLAALTRPAANREDWTKD
jgi:hypothetical protein